MLAGDHIADGKLAANAVCGTSNLGINLSTVAARAPDERGVIQQALGCLVFCLNLCNLQPLVLVPQL